MLVHPCSKSQESGFVAQLGDWVFPANFASVTEVRIRVVEALISSKVSSTADTEIVVDELVANAIVHAKTEFRVILDRLRTGIRITVQDQSVRPPEKQSPDPLDESGRGLILIDHVADDWGHHLNGEGKCVWAEVPVTF